MSEPDSNTVQKLNKAFEKETALMMISSSINWADFLTPAPMCIALLGQLMLISTEKDFSLEKQRPSNGFKYIEHPESFSASLVQVSNAGWRAFNEAHKVVPKYTNIKDNFRLLKKMLQLKRMQKIGEIALTASSYVKQF